jgi:AraC-like DNA-binding protein
MNVHFCRSTIRQFNLVQRAEMLALADPEKARSISALTHILGVSQRTLRKAFNRTHGLTPCRRLRMLRLAGAKQALLSTHAASVTEIATSFGFAELGRFSVEYRKAFGECPSATLRGTSNGSINAAVANHASLGRADRKDDSSALKVNNGSRRHIRLRQAAAYFISHHQSAIPTAVVTVDIPSAVANTFANSQYDTNAIS